MSSDGKRSRGIRPDHSGPRTYTNEEMGRYGEFFPPGTTHQFLKFSPGQLSELQDAAVASAASVSNVPLIEGGDIRHEARGGLVEGLRRTRERIEQRRAVEVQREAELEAQITRKAAADWASNVGRDMWLGGVQECLKLAKEHLYAEERGNGVLGWDDLERALEKL